MVVFLQHRECFILQTIPIYHHSIWVDIVIFLNMCHNCTSHKSDNVLDSFNLEVFLPESITDYTCYLFPATFSYQSWKKKFLNSNGHHKIFLEAMNDNCTQTEIVDCFKSRWFTPGSTDIVLSICLNNLLVLESFQYETMYCSDV